MITIGKHILDSLTTGMYSDSKVIYREYIQNACDQIDIAINSKLLKHDEGVIDIIIDYKKRYVCVGDNATGVKADDFLKTLGDIANSDKELGQNKGFRGIGRLCGLAYCDILKFTTSYAGENLKSIMICNARKMRTMLLENTKYSLDEVWGQIIEFKTEKEREKEHYFKVELFNINQENVDLLDDKKVREYLSFVAPVPYKNTFILRGQIYSHAQSIGYKIDEYCIKINGGQIFKEYTTMLKEQSGNSLRNYDEIFRLEFKNFIDKSGKIIAWMWIGLSRFEKQIPKINLMRGIRLRSSNIQLGHNNSLSALFKESRGNYYFIGEVFAVSKELIPNSQRDYFNENEARVMLEDCLRVYFFDVLHKLYYDANRVKNDYKRKEDYVSKIKEYQRKVSEKDFVDEEERRRFQFDIDKAKKSAEEAGRRLNKISIVDKDSPIAEIAKKIELKYNVDISNQQLEETYVLNGGDKCLFITSGMSRLSRNERKIVTKILSIVTDVAPREIAEQIIARVKEEMR